MEAGPCHLLQMLQVTCYLFDLPLEPFSDTRKALLSTSCSIVFNRESPVGILGFVIPTVQTGHTYRFTLLLFLLFFESDIWPE